MKFYLLLFFKLNFNQLKHFERLVLLKESHRGSTRTIFTSESVFLFHLYPNNFCFKIDIKDFKTATD